MGDRGQVEIKMPSIAGIQSSSVYLYTHWDASGLIITVQTALRKKWRWDDASYLARIIFDEMIGDDQGDETGYGIDTFIHGDTWRLITINTIAKTVSIADNEKKPKVYSFEAFIKKKFKVV